MNFYDNPAAYAKRGIDYDLFACLEYNPQDDVEYWVGDIKEVLAVFEGERDERDWRWIFELHDGRFIFLQGGCGYTGWDCQSSAHSTTVESAIEAAECAGDDTDESECHPAEKPAEKIKDILLGQLTGTKAKTWRENMDKEFGLV